MTGPWAETAPIASLRSDDLARAGVVFRHHKHLYRTLGKHLATGGMGMVYELERRSDQTLAVESVVGKVFHSNYLVQLRTDEVTRRDHRANLAALTRLAAIEHPNLLPSYVQLPIADNHLVITPRMGPTLLEMVHRRQLSPRARTKLLVQALDGLSTLHGARLLHRDFTLRNILLDAGANIACLFDFDLVLSLDDVAAVSYRSHYRGRIFGSPGWSVAPETVEQSLMDSPLSVALDVFAVGGALHGLFTDELVYGPTDDMWALLLRIAEGVVAGGRSRVHYSDAVPMVLRPIIERCLERDPTQRYPTVAAVIADVRRVLRELPDEQSEVDRQRPMRPSVAVIDPKKVRAGNAFDASITQDVIQTAEQAVWSWGYSVETSLGRVKGHAIFLASPREDLVTSGQFPDSNVFPKLVTVIDLRKITDAPGLIDRWQQHYWPILSKVRSGLVTSLHKVIVDPKTHTLLLFSEYVDEPRFAARLAELDLHLDGAVALGFLTVRQVAALHEQGMAHNNIHPGALLFKGVKETRIALPAMIGLVEPGLGSEAMASDCRALSGMILTWLRPSRVAALPAQTKAAFEHMRTRLSMWAFDPQVPAPGIDELVKLLADTLALVDFNFSVLRDSGGDLQEYAVLLTSWRLYHLLWPSSG
jgi:serine/threonine protein kinase